MLWNNQILWVQKKVAHPTLLLHCAPSCGDTSLFHKWEKKRKHWGWKGISALPLFWIHVQLCFGYGRSHTFSCCSIFGGMTTITMSTQIWVFFSFGGSFSNFPCRLSNFKRWQFEFRFPCSLPVKRGDGHWLLIDPPARPFSIMWFP